jgi:glycosyltransferase involved in cell wall biosynthesis
MTTALITSPAGAGVGGLGRASEDARDGFAAHGVGVRFVSLPPEDTARRIAVRRPLRRWPQLRRHLDRRALDVPAESWDFAWSVPGFSPSHGVRVLHQATFHPDEVRAQVAAAQVRAGGGRGFVTRREAALFRREIAAADVVRVESRAVAQSLLERGVDGWRIVHAPPGVDLERFRPGAKDADRPLIAFVGTLSLWKGVDLLVDLMGALGDRATFEVAGGPVDPWSRRLAARAHFTYTSDVPDLLRRAHALVLPSASDGFGYVVLEAMAAGAVPFVTPTVGAHDLVEGIHADLVQPAESFVAAVAELLRDLPLDDLGVRARQIAEDFPREPMARAAARSMLDALERRGVTLPAHGSA